MNLTLRLSAATVLALAGLAATAHPVAERSAAVHSAAHDAPPARWAPAPSRAEAVDARQARQAARIRHGLRTGALTHAEASRLWAQQHRIHRAERHARADGVLTHAERTRLMRMLDRAGQRIQQQKADADRRHAQGSPGRAPAHDGPRGRG